VRRNRESDDSVIQVVAEGQDEGGEGHGGKSYQNGFLYATLTRFKCFSSGYAAFPGTVPAWYDAYGHAGYAPTRLQRRTSSTFHARRPTWTTPWYATIPWPSTSWHALPS
jgi:hypothetical protein